MLRPFSKTMATQSSRVKVQQPIVKACEIVEFDDGDQCRIKQVSRQIKDKTPS